MTAQLPRLQTLSPWTTNHPNCPDSRTKGERAGKYNRDDCAISPAPDATATGQPATPFARLAGQKVREQENKTGMTAQLLQLQTLLPLDNQPPQLPG